MADDTPPRRLLPRLGVRFRVPRVEEVDDLSPALLPPELVSEPIPAESNLATDVERDEAYQIAEARAFQPRWIPLRDVLDVSAAGNNVLRIGPQIHKGFYYDLRNLCVYAEPANVAVAGDIIVRMGDFAIDVGAAIPYSRQWGDGPPHGDFNSPIRIIPVGVAAGVHLVADALGIVKRRGQ